MKGRQKDIQGNRKLDEYITIKGAKPTDKKPHSYINPLLQKKNNKQKKIQQEYHPSSIQADSNGTQKIQSQQIQIELQKKICLQMILIGPADVDYFQNSQRKIRALLENYSKINVIDYIIENAKYMKILNVNNLQSIDDNIFWNQTMPKLLEYASNISYQESISSEQCIQMILPQQKKNYEISRAKILMIIINMFLCTLPRQTNRGYLNFVYLMHNTQNQNPQKGRVRLEKLKCIIQYFNQVLKISMEDLNKQFIGVQRVNNHLNIKQQVNQIKYKLRDVSILKGLIQDRDGYDIMVDFANKDIGGGVLRNGAVQQEILFVKYTQLLALIPLVFQLQKQQALIIYNASRWVQTEGYSETFKFIGKVDQQKQKKIFPSIFVAIDAINFSQGVYKQKKQFSASSIQRQIAKAYVGFDGVEYGASESMEICTGRWGCGAFRGNIYLKFIIQWIACSMAARNMKYMAQDEQQQKQLKVLVNFIKRFVGHCDTSQLFETIVEYGKLLKEDDQLDFLYYIKRAFT